MSKIKIYDMTKLVKYTPEEQAYINSQDSRRIMRTIDRHDYALSLMEEPE